MAMMVRMMPLVNMRSMETVGTLVLVGTVHATGDDTSNPSIQKPTNGSEREVDGSCGW